MNKSKLIHNQSINSTTIDSSSFFLFFFCLCQQDHFALLVQFVSPSTAVHDLSCRQNNGNRFPIGFESHTIPGWSQPNFVLGQPNCFFPAETTCDRLIHHFDTRSSILCLEQDIVLLKTQNVVFLFISNYNIHTRSNHFGVRTALVFQHDYLPICFLQDQTIQID